MKTLNFDIAHSEVGFTVKHMMFAKVHGTFDEWTGEFYYDADNPANSKVRASIQASSVNTRNDQRDDHLRSGDFFDAERFPTLEFESTRWEETDGGYFVEGNLTIRDVTKPITLEVDNNGSGIDPWGNMRIGLSARTTLNRKEFGLTWNQALEAGGVLVGDDVKIGIEVQAVQAQSEEEAAAE